MKQRNVEFCTRKDPKTHAPEGLTTTWNSWQCSVSLLGSTQSGRWLWTRSGLEKESVCAREPWPEYPATKLETTSGRNLRPGQPPHSSSSWRSCSPCGPPWQQQSTHGLRWRRCHSEIQKPTRLQQATWSSPSCRAPCSCGGTMSSEMMTILPLYHSTTLPRHWAASYHVRTSQFELEPNI